MWQAWVNGLLGVWVFIAAFLSFSSTGNLWNDLLVGIVAAIVGFLMVKEKPWQGWLTGLLGLWLIVAAFIPSLVTHTGNMFNGVIVGVLLMIGGFGALGEGHSMQQHAH